MSDHEKLEKWLKTFNEVTLPAVIKAGFKPTPVNAREGLANLTRGLVTDIPEVLQILDDIIYIDDYDVPVRIYNPDPAKKLPVAVFIHGGGHMAGSVTVYDPICRKLALASGHIIVSVEYRLAPENSYPAGVNDVYNAVKNIWSVLDSRKQNYIKELAVIGDSGGGAFAATVAMRAQFDDEVDIKKQVLIYPSLDYTLSFPSADENGTGYVLHKSKIEWYFDNYFQKNEDRRKASPLWNEITSNISETLIFTVEYDPLRDEGLEYAKKLKEANVRFEHFHMDGMIHAFLMMEDLVKDECEFVYKKISRFLNN
jgi:acetyl esterase